jgi:hypothetical protein
LLTSATRSVFGASCRTSRATRQVTARQARMNLPCRDQVLAAAGCFYLSTRRMFDSTNFLRYPTQLIGAQVVGLPRALTKTHMALRFCRTAQPTGVPVSGCCVHRQKNAGHVCCHAWTLRQMRTADTQWEQRGSLSIDILDPSGIEPVGFFFWENIRCARSFGKMTA